MATANLPDDILIEIFSRLPAKSVGKCRCLARQWHILLSTPQFIKSHLTRKSHQESLLLITPSQSICSIDAIKDGGVSRKLELPNNWEEFVGSCDGLVLLINKRNDMLLVNPITGQQVRIPDLPLALNRKVALSLHGFGYDCVGDDYKIVTLSHDFSDIKFEPDSIDTLVDVYSVKRSAWKRVGISPYNPLDPGFSSGAFVNGAIHWLACRRHREVSIYSFVIAAFDLAHEVFYEIPAPNGVQREQVVFDRLVVLGGCLCIVDDLTNTQTDVWIMKEYGLVESWTNFTVDVRCFDESQLNVFRPLCFLGEEEVMMEMRGGGLVVYNVEVNTMRFMIVDGVPAEFMDVCTFLGSLISPAFDGLRED